MKTREQKRTRAERRNRRPAKRKLGLVGWHRDGFVIMDESATIDAGCPDLLNTHTLDAANAAGVKWWTSVAPDAPR